MSTTDWNQYFSSNEEVIYTMFAIMGMFLVFIFAMALIFLVLKVVGRWKMFDKAGEEGWKAIIPIYNTYTQCKITGISAYWIFIIFIGYLLSSFIRPLGIITNIVCVYFSVILAISTARSFGKSDGIGLGLFLLSPIFNMIIGCDSSKYEGKRPFGDILFSMDTSNDSVTSVKSESKTSNTKKVEAKKTVAKKTTSKTTTKKAAANKTTAKKSTPKKSATKKAPVKKTSTTKKTTTRKTTPKKK